MSLMITKRFGSHAERDEQYAWYCSGHSEISPGRISPLGVDRLEYEYVHGQYPYDVTMLLWHASQHLWGVSNKEMTRIDERSMTERYIRHIEWIATQEFVLRPPEKMIDKVISAVRWFLRDKTPLMLTPAVKVHGDMTLGNVIQTGCESFVYLDPGRSYGLNCVELDESKIMQSLDGWDAVRWGQRHTPAAPHPIKVTREHHVLLATHYLRLLRHSHPPDALHFAVERLHELSHYL